MHRHTAREGDADSHRQRATVTDRDAQRENQDGDEKYRRDTRRETEKARGTRVRRAVASLAAVQADSGGPFLWYFCVPHSK